MNVNPNNIFPNRQFMFMVVVVVFVISIWRISTAPAAVFLQTLLYGLGASLCVLGLSIVVTSNDFMYKVFGKQRESVLNMTVVGGVLIIIGGAMVAVAEFLM